MLIGNSYAQKTIQEFFESVQSTDQSGFPFLLLSGQRHVGKTSCVEEHISSLLGEFSIQDYLPLYDLCEITGKKHTLKVEVASKDQAVQGDDGIVYQNLGARECIQRLSRSPAGKYKILFLENIERMTPSAANSLLKSLEEPLPNRLIIATTTNYKTLLDTIISRAMIIRFQSISHGDMKTYIDSQYPQVASPIREFVIAYTVGGLGRARNMLEGESSLGEMSELFTQSLHFFREGGSLVKQYQRMQKWVKEYGSVEDLINALLYAMKEHETSGVDSLLEAKKMLQSNVSLDTLLFRLSLA